MKRPKQATPVLQRSLCAVELRCYKNRENKKKTKSITVSPHCSTLADGFLLPDQHGAAAFSESFPHTPNLRIVTRAAIYVNPLLESSPQ